MLIESVWGSPERALSDLEIFKKDNPFEYLPEQFEKIRSDIDDPRGLTVYDETVEFSFWKRGLPSRQECFRDFLKPILERGGFRSVLEVGGGRTGRLSHLLASEGYRVTCMEPKLGETQGSMKPECGSGNGGDTAGQSACQENPVLIKQFFDYHDADLSPYDIVIGQEPCDATEHIVRSCLAQEKPFVILLCGAVHEYISGGRAANVEEWYDYLEKLTDGKASLRYDEVCYGFRSVLLMSRGL